MARQPYEARRVLGRSAHQPLTRSPSNAAEEPSAATEKPWPSGRGDEQQTDVQQYDRQGYAINPRSKQLARQSRRAQNDILSTVNVCVRVDKNGQPVIQGKIDGTATIAKIRQENGSGLLLGTVDWCLFCLTTLCLVSLRHRLQAFSFYSETSLLDIIKSEWKHLGFRGFLYPGALATILFRYLEHARPQILRSLYNRITRHFIWPVRSATNRKHFRMAMDLMEQVFKIAMFTLIAPLEIFATLQRLNLAPSLLLLPHFRALIPFSVSSPIHFRRPSHGTFSGYLEASVLSPITLLWLLLLTKSRVDERLYIYIGNVLPKPTNPNRACVEAAQEDGLTNEHILGLCQRNEASFNSQDMRRAYSSLVGLPARMMRWARGQRRNPIDEAEKLRALDQSGFESNTDAHTSMSPILSPPASPSSNPNPFATEHSASAVEDIARASQRHADAARARQRFVPDHLRHVDLPQRHVTTLTSHTADALAMHLSTHIADLIFLPLEGLFVRSVAVGFLSAAVRKVAPGPALGLRNQVIPLSHGFGMGIRPGDSLQYVRNLALCVALEVAVGLGIWQLSTGAAWYMGWKWFSWGKSSDSEEASERSSSE